MFQQVILSKLTHKRTVSANYTCFFHVVQSKWRCFRISGCKSLTKHEKSNTQSKLKKDKKNPKASIPFYLKRKTLAVIDADISLTPLLALLHLYKTESIL